MHSLAMAQDILKAAICEAKKQKARRIRAFLIKLGDGHSDEADSIQFCLEVASRGTIAEGARIEIEPIGTTFCCCDCKRVFSIRNHSPLCPYCGSDDAEALVDDDFLKVALELD